MATDLNNEIDSSTWNQTAEDPALRTKIEGGYVVTRRKYTRPPRRSWKLGWTETTDYFKGLVEVLWNAVGGGSDSFTMIDPPTGATITVRFSAQPTYQYVGVRDAHRWTITAEVEEV
jgi:hypothetical protein